MLLSMSSYSQVNNNDISTWPEPTILNISDSGFYNTKDKILRYFKWKAKWSNENLPNFYFKEDEYYQVRELLLPYYSFEEAEKQVEIISLDSLHKLDIKKFLWIKQRLEENKEGSPCFYLENYFNDIYLVKIDSNNFEASLHKMECLNNILDNDDETQYKIERQGDSLIIIKFLNEKN